MRGWVRPAIRIATKDLRIEERPPEEVTGYRGARWAPEGVAVRNPAFDVTPAELITGIITERGIVRKPTRARVASLLSRNRAGAAAARRARR